MRDLPIEPARPLATSAAGPRHAALEPLRSSLPMDDPELRDIAREFVELAQEQVDQLAAALVEADAEGARRALHWLKGSAGSGGYMPISAAAAAAHQRLRTTGLADLPPIADELRHLLDRARAAFADPDTP